MSAQGFYYRDKEGREVGPLSLDTLAKFRASGVLEEDTLVREAESKTWKQCREIVATPMVITPAPQNELPASGKLRGRNFVFIGLAVLLLWMLIGLPHLKEAKRQGEMAVDTDSAGRQSRQQAKRDNLRMLEDNTASKRNACINNLRQIDGAMQQWALENKKSSTARPTPSDIVPYLGRGDSVTLSEIVCPSGGTTFYDSYRLTDVQTAPTCISSGGGTANGHSLD